MDSDKAVIHALQQRIKSLEIEAKILRERRKTSDNNLVAARRTIRQYEHGAQKVSEELKELKRIAEKTNAMLIRSGHKLEERTIRVRRLEKACKLGLANLRQQDTDGVYWCLTTQKFDKHHAGTKAPGCRYCRVYRAVNDAINGGDLADDFVPAGEI